MDLSLLYKQVKGTFISLFQRAPGCDSETQTPGSVGNSISVMMGPPSVPQGCTKMPKGLNWHQPTGVLSGDSVGVSFLMGFCQRLGV